MLPIQFMIMYFFRNLPLLACNYIRTCLVDNYSGFCLSACYQLWSVQKTMLGLSNFSVPLNF
jgi:hypothetical protein